MILKLLKMRRLELKKTQLDIANELSITKQYISLIENDRLKFSASKTIDLYKSYLFSKNNIDLEESLIEIFTKHLLSDEYLVFTNDISKLKHISYDDYLAYLVIKYVVSARNNTPLFFEIDDIIHWLSDDLKLIVTYAKMANYISVKNYSKALTIYDEVINKVPINYISYFNFLYVIYLIDNNQTYYALEIIYTNKVIIKDINNAVYAFYLSYEANCYNILFNFRKSQEVYNYLLDFAKQQDIQSFIKETSYDLSMSYIKSHKYQEALSITNSIEVEDDDMYHMIKSICHFNNTDQDLAIYHYDKISTNKEFKFIKSYIKFKYLNYEKRHLVYWLTKLKSYSFSSNDSYYYTFALNELINETVGKQRLAHFNEYMNYIKNIK